MSNSGFQQPRPASRHEDLTEPMPWVSRARSVGSLRLPGLRYPVGSLIYGVVLAVVGVAAFLGLSLGHGTGAFWSGLVLLVVLAGLGIWMIVIAAVRWAWFGNYTKLHGHPPF